MYNSRYNCLYYNFLAGDVMHPASGACDQWKWSTISDEFRYSNNVWKMLPPEPLCCGRTGIAGTFKFKKQLNNFEEYYL